MSRSNLEGRLRLLSRIALYTSLTLTVALGALLVYMTRDPLRPEIVVTWGDIDYASLEEVQLLQDYVRIDTSRKTGNVLDGARFLAGLLESEGVPVHMERVGDRDVNLWGIVEGREPGAIVLHSHIDVNDIDQPKKWLFPPFDAHVRPPWLYGRGTYDMKSVAIAQFLALRDLVRSGVRPRKSIIFLATSSEETGSAFGTQWILQTHPDLVKRFDLVLSEGGVVEARGIENLKYYGIEFEQKRYWTLAACSDSRERLEHLQQDLKRYGSELDSDLQLPEEIKRYLELYAPTRDAARLREAFSDPGATCPGPPPFREHARIHQGHVPQRAPPSPHPPRGRRRVGAPRQDSPASGSRARRRARPDPPEVAVLRCRYGRIQGARGRPRQPDGRASARDDQAGGQRELPRRPCRPDVPALDCDRLPLLPGRGASRATASRRFPS